MSKIYATITAVGGYVPPDKLTNKDLEKLVDTTEEWIVTRTGMKERRILKGAHKATSDMATPVVLEICKKRNISPETIDCIIVATTTPDFSFPSTANLTAHKAGAKNAWSFDLSAACSGFLFGLNTGAGLIESGRYKKVIVIGADKMSSITNYSDRNTCILFGDGAGGVLLEPDTKPGITDSILKGDGIGNEYLYMKGGGSYMPCSLESLKNNHHFIYQEGKTVFKYAVNCMCDVVVKIMEKNKLTKNDIAYLIPHQANLRIIEAMANFIDLPKEKISITLDKYGNTSAATIPLCLWEYEKKFKKGDNIILISFGAGFTWGATWIQWNL